MIPAIGLAVGLAGGIGKLFGRGKANRQLSRLLANQPQYKENPLAKQRLGLAQTIYNARMPGAVSAERNIYANQANQVANINRAATDASQALALAAGSQSQTNQAFTNLGMAEAQDQQRRYENLSGAQQGVIAEQDKVFQDQIRRWENEAQIRGTQQANRQANWGDIGSMGFGLMDFGLAGGFKQLFGKKNNSRGGSPAYANTWYGDGYNQNSGYSDFQNPWQ